LVERWQKKTALLVFSALAYVLAKNQMCCLRVGVFSSNVQFQHDFRIMHNVIVYD
tara:strand:- start:19341 stop:19505 length:165 start_codon:yes stop_codon:yes gene_type:complete